MYIYVYIYIYIYIYIYKDASVRSMIAVRPVLAI